MFPLFNRGSWKNMEDGLKNYIATNRGSYRMTVTMTYATAADEVPGTLSVTLEVEGPPGTWTQVHASQHNQPADIVRTPGLSLGDQHVVRGGGARAAISVFHFSGDQFETEGKGLTAYVNEKGYMPRSNKAYYPDDPNNRVYGLLDVLALNGQLASTGLMTVATGMSAFRDFSPEQRKLILQTNMARHGGALVSDDPADPHQNLDERGAANAPEVDHIVPKSLGGSNYFSNARVISWQLNNREARVQLHRPRRPRPARGAAADRHSRRQGCRGRRAGARARRTSPQLTVNQTRQWAAQTWPLPQTPGRAATQRAAIRAELDRLVTDGKLTKRDDKSRSFDGKGRPIQQATLPGALPHNIGCNAPRPLVPLDQPYAGADREGSGASPPGEPAGAEAGLRSVAKL